MRFHFNQWADLASQLELSSHTSFSFMRTNQSGRITANQDSAIWTNLIVKILMLYLHKNEPIRDQGSSLPIISGAELSISLLLLGCFSPGAVIFPRGYIVPSLQKVYQNKVSPPLHLTYIHQTGDSWWHWVGGPDPLLTKAI